MPKGSDLLVAALENEGVDRIFGVPGEENLDVVESLRGSTIKLILTRHEQAAAFMAATYGRLTGKPGVCITTLGPGALNLATGAAYALLGAMPMVMLTGQKGILSSRQANLPTYTRGKKSDPLPPTPPHPIEIPIAHRASLDRAAEMILKAKRPLVMLGAAASRPRSTAGIGGFGRRRPIPFFTN